MKKQTGLLLFLLPLAAAAQTHLDVASDRLSLRHSLSAAVFENPAHQPVRFDHSFSSIAVGYDYNEADSHYVVQTGKGERFAEFDASSYIRMGHNSCAWGEARYRNGAQTDVKWNENADYDRLFPYVTADTLGGNLNYESYYFKGGYAIDRKRLSVGAQMAYSSSLHYRQTDPRPKDNATFINASLGIGYRLSGSYSLGAYTFAERYTQNQSIEFLDPLGSVPVYHMTGLGMHYVRFAGTKTSAIYKGRTYRGGLTLKRLATTGFDAALQIENYQLQKQLPSLSNAPINDINQNRYDIHLSWQMPRLLLGLNGSLSRRKGTERIYDDGTTNWHEIASSSPYKYTTAQLQASALTTLTANRWEFELMPQAGFVTDEESYHPSRFQQLRKASLRLTAGLRYRTGRHLLSAQGEGGWLHCLSATQRIDNPDSFTFTNQMLRQNFENLSADLASARLYLQHNIQLRRISASVFWRIGYVFASTFGNYTLHGANVSVGLTI